MRNITLTLILFACLSGFNLTYGQNTLYWYKAQYEFKQKNFEEALKAYTKCIELNDLIHQAYYKRACCYLELKQFEEAEADIKMALKVPKDSEDYIFVKGNGYWLYSSIISYHSNSTKSLRLMKKAAQYNNSSRLYSTLGFKEVELGKYKDALKNLNLAIEIDSLNPWAYSNRAWAYLNLNELDKARQDIITSKKLDDQNPYVYKHSAMIYIALQDYEAACSELQKAQELECSYEMAAKKSIGVSELINSYCNKADKL